ncbi:response regulator transcription factor [Acetobacterium bakii]|uniref:Stage 0 sporulation protein A homolog n=1 Tax=Acetobacterium bakii TaxID=52689 RepID=A0A0L6TXF6_9FIRM|nr:response regulator [Acetobacterium bakii]KNZ40255.1 hypothetical protein AKG39_18580 [Acetobacterium bakii]
MLRVLVADDEYLMREALTRMILKIDGFEVVHAVDTGTEAVRICEKEDIDIAFMDIMMPEMNGIEAGRRIKAMKKGVSIYILTAYNKLDYLQEALKMKAEEYLLKPVSQSKIEEILKQNIKRCDWSVKIEDRINDLLNFKSYREMYYGVPHFVEKLEDGGDYSAIVQNLIRNYPQSENGIRSLVKNQFVHKKEFEYFLLQSMDCIYRNKAMEKHPILLDTFNYLDNHLTENIGLKEITRDCNVSQGYLSRIFKVEFGVSVMEYIHMRKMMLAKWYFLANDVSLTDVAYRLGYNECSYFSKVFKKYEHVTVLEYKKSLNSDCR